MASRRKQAVILIHGIGEQRPLETLRSFVESVLPPAPAGQEQYWSKPDSMSDLFELRRLQGTQVRPTHFFEYYWAHHVEGTKLSHLAGWLRGLLFRRPANVPQALRKIWFATWASVVALLVLTAGGVISQVFGWYSVQSGFGLVSLIVIGLTTLLQGFLVHYVGDAARYLSPNPRNVTLRQKIRADGVRLLKHLHDSHEYERIIIVGHSLGSVIGYDIITHLWLQYNKSYDFKTNEKELEITLKDRRPPQPVIRKELLEAGERLRAKPSQAARDQYRDSQGRAWKEQKKWGNGWRISDFVTLGSPLSHAVLLLAKDDDEFKKRKRQRELPSCPPVVDERGYTYPSPASVTLASGRIFTPLVLHHAAPFAVTRWTNLYFPALMGLFGDLIAGPLADAFGPGIMDIPVRIAGWKRFSPFSHTAYWSEVGTISEKSPDNSAQPAREALVDTLGLNTAGKSKSSSASR